MKIEFDMPERLFNDFSLMAQAAGVPLRKCLEDYFEDFPGLLGDRCEIFKQLLDSVDEAEALAIIDRAKEADPVNNPPELAFAVREIFAGEVDKHGINFQAIDPRSFELPEEIRELCEWVQACIQRIGVEPRWQDDERLILEHGLGRMEAEEFALLCHASLILSGKVRACPVPAPDESSGEDWEDAD